MIIYAHIKIVIIDILLKIFENRIYYDIYYEEELYGKTIRDIKTTAYYTGHVIAA